MQRRIEIEPFPDDSHAHVSGYRNPYLALDDVLGGAEEAFYAKALLDLLEGQVHLPMAFIERAYAQIRVHEVAGQQYQRFAGFRVLDADTVRCAWARVATLS